MGKHRVRDTESFIERSIEIHGARYDYSKVVYTNSSGKVVIICRDHGEFTKTANSHLMGNGCAECNRVNWKPNPRRGNGPRKTTKQFVEELKKVQKYPYDYSKVVYTDSRDNVTLICRDHGEFQIRVANALNGQGCRGCSVDRNRKTTNQFNSEMKELYGDLYDLSRVDYKTRMDPVLVGCPDHGFVKMIPKYILRGRGCVECGKEKKWVGAHEKLLFQPMIKEVLGEENVHFQHNFEQFYVDAYIPKLGLVIEYDEDYHSRQLEKDKERQFLIETIHDVVFYRIKDKELVKVPRDVESSFRDYIGRMIEKQTVC
jgi:very-short-patch-repair endonuclease